MIWTNKKNVCSKSKNDLKSSINQKSLTRNYSPFMFNFLSERYWVTIDTLKDCKMVYASMSPAFDLHSNLGHLASTDESITIYMNVWCSKDYVPGLILSSSLIMSDKKIIKIKKG